jgi:hypothetical protein
MLRMGKIIL